MNAQKTSLRDSMYKIKSTWKSIKKAKTIYCMNDRNQGNPNQNCKNKRFLFGIQWMFEKLSPNIKIKTKTLGNVYIKNLSVSMNLKLTHWFQLHFKRFNKTQVDTTITSKMNIITSFVKPSKKTSNFPNDAERKRDKVRAITKTKQNKE